ncbi:MAG TPA: GNAT family N-acetyltransferase [Burkholderiaceae bacterium]|nr:GNAT family N-acetyltransferase [Burkholderiaceae bacterium]
MPNEPILSQPVAPTLHGLGPTDLPAIRAHYLALPDSDRLYRFGHFASDAAVLAHCEQLERRPVTLFGAFDAQGRLIALAEAAPYMSAMELGLSVLPAARRQGLGQALLAAAAAHAREVGYRRLYVSCLAENTPMRALARAAGMQVQCEGADAHGYLVIDDDVPAAPQAVTRDAAPQRSPTAAPYDWIQPWQLAQQLGEAFTRSWIDTLRLGQQASWPAWQVWPRAAASAAKAREFTHGMS